MKKRTKFSGKYQRRYESGILMYRERKNLVEVPANVTVTVRRVDPKRTLCEYKGFLVFIPNENLPQSRQAAPAKAVKAPTRELVAA